MDELLNNKPKIELMNRNQDSIEATGQGGERKKRKSEMTAAERVGALQEKLYNTAKQKRDYKFYILYDKVFIPYMLEEAYERVRQNGGAPGIDGITFKQIEEGGRKEFLEELGEDLRKRTYKPKAVKRVWIPKANGGKRPLGIPTIRDRVAQQVCKMIMEPIFEADFEDSSYGFRPGRSSKDAMMAIKQYLQEGRTEVLDADLSSYFDTIPHDKLMIALRQRISDERIMQLIELWLKSPIYEDGQYTGGKKSKAGTPQGGVISPLLANIYMHLVDRIVNHKGSLFYKQGIKIVRYADDFVLMGKTITHQVTDKLKEILKRMGLTLNEQKTRMLQAKETPFNFLGFTVRYDKDLYTGNKRYWNIVPSEKSEKKVREKVREFLQRAGHFTPGAVAVGLTEILRGWLNYFDIPKVSYPAMSKRDLRYYLIDTLYRYYNRKSQRRSSLHGTQAFEMLVSQHGLLNPVAHYVHGRMVNAGYESHRKAVCGKTARTV